MPNYCNYEIKVKGSKNAINNLLECLKAHYDYTEGKPTHKHFFRVFEVIEGDYYKEGKDYVMYILGYCAWSVHSAMVSKASESYYTYLKKEHPQEFMGTTLLEESKNCEIEVFSEEIGCEFSEHYIFKNGKCLLDECVEIELGGYDKNGKPTKDIDWEEYEGYTIAFNPNREGIDEAYRWTI